MLGELLWSGGGCCEAWCCGVGCCEVVLCWVSCYGVVGL